MSGWTDITASNTTARNDSRFIQAAPYLDDTGGVDFAPPITAVNPWIISTSNPITLSSTHRNDPV